MTTHAKSSHVFTEKDLWGADGRPGGNDIQQKWLGDCFLVAAAGSVAQQTGCHLPTLQESMASLASQEWKAQSGPERPYALSSAERV